MAEIEDVRVTALEMAMRFDDGAPLDQVIRNAEKIAAFLETGKVPGASDAKPDFVADEETIEAIVESRREKKFS